MSDISAAAPSKFLTRLISGIVRATWQPVSSFDYHIEKARTLGLTGTTSKTQETGYRIKVQRVVLEYWVERERYPG
jgi:hypothetical protein